MKYKMKLLVLFMFFILVNNKYKTIDKDMQSEIGNVNYFNKGHRGRFYICEY